MERGSIEEEELTIQLRYSNEIHHRATIDRLAGDILDTVRELLRGGVDPSPADFPHADLSQDELDDLLRDYGDGDD